MSFRFSYISIYLHCFGQPLVLKYFSPKKITNKTNTLLPEQFQKFNRTITSLAWYRHFNKQLYLARLNQLYGLKPPLFYYNIDMSFKGIYISVLLSTHSHLLIRLQVGFLHQMQQDQYYLPIRMTYEFSVYLQKYNKGHILRNIIFPLNIFTTLKSQKSFLFFLYSPKDHENMSSFACLDYRWVKIPVSKTMINKYALQ